MPELFVSYLTIQLCMASNPAPATTVHKTLAEQLSPPGIVPPQPKRSCKCKRAHKASYHSHHPPHATSPGSNTPPTLLARLSTPNPPPNSLSLLDQLYPQCE